MSICTQRVASEIQNVERALDRLFSIYGKEELSGQNSVGGFNLTSLLILSLSVFSSNPFINKMMPIA